MDTVSDCYGGYPGAPTQVRLLSPPPISRGVPYNHPGTDRNEEMAKHIKKKAKKKAKSKGKK